MKPSNEFEQIFRSDVSDTLVRKGVKYTSHPLSPHQLMAKHPGSWQIAHDGTYPSCDGREVVGEMVFGLLGDRLV